jgi:hypothetical protein
MNDDFSESKNDGIVLSLAVKCKRHNGDVYSACIRVRSRRVCIYQIYHNGCSCTDGVKNATGNFGYHIPLLTL